MWIVTLNKSRIRVRKVVPVHYSSWDLTSSDWWWQCIETLVFSHPSNKTIWKTFQSDQFDILFFSIRNKNIFTKKWNFYNIGLRQLLAVYDIRKDSYRRMRWNDLNKLDEIEFELLQRVDKESKVDNKDKKMLMNNDHTKWSLTMFSNSDCARFLSFMKYFAYQIVFLFRFSYLYFMQTTVRRNFSRPKITRQWINSRVSTSVMKMSYLIDQSYNDTARRISFIYDIAVDYISLSLESSESMLLCRKKRFQITLI